jgi:hypothetical protein
MTGAGSGWAINARQGREASLAGQRRKTGENRGLDPDPWHDTLLDVSRTNNPLFLDRAVWRRSYGEQQLCGRHEN